jgi:hypothetical protein
MAETGNRINHRTTNGGALVIGALRNRESYNEVKILKIEISHF